MSGSRMRAVSAAAALVMGAALLAGCASQPVERAPRVVLAAATERGCPATAARTPVGAEQRRTVDVDGDGRSDTEWITARRFGVTTASGATSSVRIAVAGAATPQGLVARLNPSGPVLAFVAGSRDVQLFRYLDCALRPVTNPTGGQWRFDLTGRHGTGVGCQDADGDGRVDLNGLRLERPIGSVPTGTYVDVARTIVRISGTRASIGPTDTVSARAGSSALASATTVTCGGLTLAADGVLPSGARGCVPNATRIPAGAAERTISDVDGDGRPDTEFSAETATGLVYGIRTASGRTVLLRDDLAGPAVHAGWTAVFEGSPPLTVLDDGREATLHAFVDCGFRMTTDRRGVPWRFGLNGFSPYGSGVECTSGTGRGGRALEGVLATRLADGRYRITSTVIEVTHDGRIASAGPSRTAPGTFAEHSAAVVAAMSSTCEHTPIVSIGGR